MAEAWVRKTPDGFEFAVKAWQKFTHAKQIGEGVGVAEASWESPDQADVDLFLRGIRPLQESGRLGALLFQYPPGFHRTTENLERLGWTLRAFNNCPKVVELRHRSWSNQFADTRALLKDCGANWALIDEPKFESSVRQEFAPDEGILYLRLHGRNYEKWWNHDEAWERYDYLYSPKAVAEISRSLKSPAPAGGKRPGKAFVFFNNHARGQAVVNAIMLSHEMGSPVTARPIAQMLRDFPQLSGLVPAPSEDTLF
jgi:uncharacterized protein YecE (DUF72 family)